MSRNILLTSTVGLLPSGACISYMIESSWAIHESLAGKPDFKALKSLLL